MPDPQNQQIAIFKGKTIRKIIFNKEWYFSVVDIIQILLDQPDDLKARKYWNKLAQRLREEGSEVVTDCHQLKLIAPDGKMRETDCASTETMFRIIQSVPSPKAEPLKRWLAKVDYERMRKINYFNCFIHRLCPAQSATASASAASSDFIFSFIPKTIATIVRIWPFSARP